MLAPAMNVIPDDLWTRLAPVIKRSCPRLTDLDLREAHQRVDLLTAKIQNRHWVSRIAGRRMVLSALGELGLDVA